MQSYWRLKQVSFYLCNNRESFIKYANIKSNPNINKNDFKISGNTYRKDI